MMNFKTWIESLALKGNYKGNIFQRLVAATYVILPTFEQEAIAGYQDLMRKISRQNDFLQSKFTFNPSSVDSYKSMKHLTSEINKQKKLGVKRPIMNVYSEPPIGPSTPIKSVNNDLPGSTGHALLSNDQNVMLRGVHDAIAHYMGQHPFSARGEYAAYNRHLKTLCDINQVKSNKSPVAQVLFTEIIGQTSYYYVYGSYTIQKAAIMPDFDCWNVGALSSTSPLNNFFELTNKSLMPRSDFNYSQFENSFPVLANEMKRQLNGNATTKLDILPNEQTSAFA